MADLGEARVALVNSQNVTVEISEDPTQNINDDTNDKLSLIEDSYLDRDRPRETRYAGTKAFFDHKQPAIVLTGKVIMSADVIKKTTEMGTEDATTGDLPIYLWALTARPRLPATDNETKRITFLGQLEKDGYGRDQGNVTTPGKIDIRVIVIDSTIKITNVPVVTQNT